MAQQQPAGGQGQVQQSQQGGQGGQQPPHKPPREAFEACSGKAAGATCGFTGREGRQVNGTCSAPRESTSLAGLNVCHPQHREGERPQSGQQK
jgi:hypothetical protein